MSSMNATTSPRAPVAPYAANAAGTQRLPALPLERIRCLPAGQALVVARRCPPVTAQLTPGELARLFELMGYQGAAQTFIDRQIGSLQSRAIKRP